MPQILDMSIWVPDHHEEHKPVISAPKGQDDIESKFILDYIESSRPLWGTQWDPIKTEGAKNAIQW